MSFRLLFFSVFIYTSSLHASNLPKPEYFQGIINVCSAGRSVEVKGALSVSINKLFSQGVSGDAKISDLGGIIAAIDDDKLKADVFKLYLSCVIPAITDILDSKAKVEKNYSTTGSKSPIVDSSDGDVNINY